MTNPFYHDGAIRLYQQAGGQGSDRNLVKLPPEAVTWALSKALRRITLHRRRKGRDTPYGNG